MYCVHTVNARDGKRPPTNPLTRPLRELLPLFVLRSFWASGLQAAVVQHPASHLVSLHGVDEAGWGGRVGVFESLLLFLSCYFFISTTIHPWYIINLILVGIISGYAFPIIWSLTVFWSYNTYSSNVIQENIVLQLFSYCLVYGCFFYEIYFKKLGHHLQKPNFFSS